MWKQSGCSAVIYNIKRSERRNHHTEVVRKKAAQILRCAQRNLTMVKSILFYGTPRQKLTARKLKGCKFIHGSNQPLATQKKVSALHWFALFQEVWNGRERIVAWLRQQHSTHTPCCSIFPLEKIQRESIRIPSNYPLNNLSDRLKDLCTADKFPAHFTKRICGSLLVCKTCNNRSKIIIS